MSENTIKTVLVCYTQGAFDKLALTAGDAKDGLDDTTELVTESRQVAVTAQKLTLALQNFGLEAEIVKMPLRSYASSDLTKAAFGWRLLDLTESNGQVIDMLICLDFPAWSVSHPRKVCWVLNLPFFVTHQPTATPLLRAKAAVNQKIDPEPTDFEAETVRDINSLLQAERRGLSEAKRLLAGQRAVAEELTRNGLQVEYNPVPSPDAEPTSETWQKVASRFLF